MKFGISIFPTADAIRPADLAVAAEQRGFDSFWVPEHSHIPVSDVTPGPDQPGLPPMYYQTIDCFVTLATVAQATEKILIGTSICLVVQRDPIQLAKEVASLDVLSNGRFQFGVGAGWNRPEIENHGTPFHKRLGIMRERIEAMKKIWTEEKAEYHGKYVDFGPMYAWPKPVQQPHPPIHVAANLPNGMKRVVGYGDGWLPMPGTGETEPTQHIATLREKVAASGRDPKAFEISMYYCPPEDGMIEQMAGAGVDRVIFVLDPNPRDQALPQLDELTRVADRHR
jgi:probable F420-dependent oxidoreductase